MPASRARSLLDWSAPRFSAAAQSGAIAEALLAAAAAHHRADAAEQQRSADHAGRRCRRGSEKRAAASAHRRSAHRRHHGACGAPGRTAPERIARDPAPAASPGRCSMSGGWEARAAAHWAPSRAAEPVRRSSRASNRGTRRIAAVHPRRRSPVPGYGRGRASAPRPAAGRSAPARRPHWAPCAGLREIAAPASGSRGALSTFESRSKRSSTNWRSCGVMASLLRSDARGRCRGALCRK